MAASADHHERRKDKTDREKLEQQRLEIEVQTLNQQLLGAYIKNLKLLGAKPKGLEFEG